METRLEHTAFRLGLARDLVQPVTEPGLDEVRSILERLQGLVALPLDGAAGAGDSLFDAFARGLRDGLTRSVSTPSAWRANRSTARSSSRLSRRAASSRADRIVVSKVRDAASV